MAGASEGAVMGGLVRGVDFVGFDEVRDKIAEQDDTLCWKDINVEKFEEDPRGYLDILFSKSKHAYDINNFLVAANHCIF